MEEYDYDNPILKKQLEDDMKPTKYQGPDYDEEYLKQFESMKPGDKFTQEQLEEITDKAFLGHLRDRELADRFNYPGFYDEVVPDRHKSDEQVWREVERYYGSRENKNFNWDSAKITFMIGKGGVSLYQTARMRFQLMIKERYEK